MVVIKPIRQLDEDLFNPATNTGSLWKSWVRQMEYVRMRLGEADASERRRPISIEGSEFTMNVDTVIIAIGTRVNKLIQMTTPELKVDGKGHIAVNRVW